MRFLSQAQLVLLVILLVLADLVLLDEALARW